MSPFVASVAWIGLAWRNRAPTAVNALSGKTWIRTLSHRCNRILGLRLVHTHFQMHVMSPVSNCYCYLTVVGFSMFYGLSRNRDALFHYGDITYIGLTRNCSCLSRQFLFYDSVSNTVTFIRTGISTACPTEINLSLLRYMSILVFSLGQLWAAAESRCRYKVYRLPVKYLTSQTNVKCHIFISIYCKKQI